MKPGPLTSTAVAHAVDVERGDDLGRDLARRQPTFLASARAALTCTSANCDGRSTGSASRCSSPSAAAIADWTLGVSATSGETMRQEV